jgi:transcriptional regulator with XRE-family HTH domain
MIGNKIKTIRLLKGIKQKELADKIGKTAGFLSLIESNERDLTINTLKKIANALKIPTQVLLM